MMQPRFKLIAMIAASLAAGAPQAGLGQELKAIPLLPPKTEGGMPLMQALKQRQTGRSFSPKKLPDQVLSDLLWAAHGINRPSEGKRTAPSARNWQEMNVYLANADGVFLYEPKAHALLPVMSQDLRAATGSQDFVKDAPVNLVLVADTARMTGTTPGEDQAQYMGIDTGVIVQNVYLYCASSGLATVVRGSVDRKALAEAMKLRPTQRIVVAQTVGYPGEEAAKPKQ